MKRRKSVLFLSLAVICIATILLSSCGSKTQRAERTPDEPLEGIEFRGIGEDTVPLAASNLVLLHSTWETWHYYTIVGTLKKTSTNPEEGFFSFNVVLIDENGRQVDSGRINTMPGGSGRSLTDNKLLSVGNTFYLELEIVVFSSHNTPVAVDFTDIVEGDKSEFIRITLDNAIDSIGEQDYDYAKRRVDLVLSVDPGNAEALALLEQIAELEAQEEAPAPPTDDPTPTPETPETSETPESTETPETTPANGSTADYDWQQWLKDYEEWVDDYVAFMEKYNKNPTDLTLLSDYMEFSLKAVEWAEQAETLEDELTGDDLKEYLATMTRIAQKLIAIVD